MSFYWDPEKDKYGKGVKPHKLLGTGLIFLPPGERREIQRSLQPFPLQCEDQDGHGPIPWARQTDLPPPPVDTVPIRRRVFAGLQHSAPPPRQEGPTAGAIWAVRAGVVVAREQTARRRENEVICVNCEEDGHLNQDCPHPAVADWDQVLGHTTRHDA